MNLDPGEIFFGCVFVFLIVMIPVSSWICREASKEQELKTRAKSPELLIDPEVGGYRCSSSNIARTGNEDHQPYFNPPVVVHNPDIHAPTPEPRCESPVVDWAKVGRELDLE